MLSCRRQRAQLNNGRNAPGTSFADIFGASFLTFHGDVSLPAARATNFGFAGARKGQLAMNLSGSGFYPPFDIDFSEVPLARFCFLRNASAHEVGGPSIVSGFSSSTSRSFHGVYCSFDS